MIIANNLGNKNHFWLGMHACTLNVLYGKELFYTGLAAFVCISLPVLKSRPDFRSWTGLIWPWALKPMIISKSFKLLHFSLPQLPSHPVAQPCPNQSGLTQMSSYVYLQMLFWFKKSCHIRTWHSLSEHCHSPYKCRWSYWL